MRFQPIPAPENPARVRTWAASMFRAIADALEVPTAATFHVETRGAAPDKYSDGDIVYADGSSWDPGSGEGFYGREGGAWVKL